MRREDIGPVFICCGAALLLAGSSSAASNLIANPGFETVETIECALPTSFADWTGDPVSFVSAENGITPSVGTAMLRFDTTTCSGPDGSDSTVIQAIDLSSYSSQIASGGATVQAQAFFNRVSGDSETDTEFRIGIIACSGSPADAETCAAASEAENRASIFTTANQWNMLAVSLTLPATTDYVALLFMAVEDISNDGTSPEFDGHYVDSVSLEVAPTVPTLSRWGFIILFLLLTTGGLLSHRWRPVSEV